jgi:hypothetical protein
MTGFNRGRLSFSTVATRLAFFAADFSSAPWLGHGYTPFVASDLNYPAIPSPSSPARILLSHLYERETTAFFQKGCTMLKLDSGNVLLKPSHRRQLMSWLKRAIRFGQRIGNPAISIIMHRVGRMIEVRADVADQKGTVAFRSRQNDWKHAARELVRMITSYLHDRMVHRLPA